jgi:hypothetical protein
MSLDKKLRVQPTPDKFLGSRQPCTPVDIRSYSHPSLRWQEQIIYANLMHAQMILHRPFFALSLLESGTDLSHAKYAKSVIAVFDGAKALLSQFLWLREHEIGTLRKMHMWPLYAMLCLVCSRWIIFLVKTYAAPDRLHLAKSLPKHPRVRIANHLSKHSSSGANSCWMVTTRISPASSEL